MGMQRGDHRLLQRCRCSCADPAAAGFLVACSPCRRASCIGASILLGSVEQRGLVSDCRPRLPAQSPVPLLLGERRSGGLAPGRVLLVLAGLLPLVLDAVLLFRALEDRVLVRDRRAQGLLGPYLGARSALGRGFGAGADGLAVETSRLLEVAGVTCLALCGEVAAHRGEPVGEDVELGGGGVLAGTQGR